MLIADREKRREIERRSYAKHRDRRLELARKWRADNPEKLRDIKRKWNANNREKIKEQRRRRPLKPLSLEATEAKRASHRKNRYGVTPKMFDSMMVEQNYCCKICSKKPSPNKTLTVDHCHSTGNIRGLLCTACNVAIGNLGDDEAGLLRALAYIRGSV